MDSDLSLIPFFIPSVHAVFISFVYSPISFRDDCGTDEKGTQYLHWINLLNKKEQRRKEHIIAN
jgi:hypothetical protein